MHKYLSELLFLEVHIVEAKRLTGTIRDAVSLTQR